jgi:CheY-like chemotaxis protein
LVSNAIKFTEKGRVTLSAVRVDSPKDLEPDRVSVLFEVADTGIGLSPKQAEGLFSAFTQADASTTRKYGGTGLGLAISKGLVEKMGGEIWLESQLGEGTTMSFFIPFAAGKPSRPRKKLSFKGARVLVLAQNPDFLANLIAQLKSLEAEPVAAQSPEEFFEEFGKDPTGFKVLLVDEAYSRYPGFEESLKRLRGDPPIILIVASSSYLSPLGFDGAHKAVLLKPVRPVSLAKALAGALKISSRLNQAESDDKPFETPDFSGYRALLAEDNEVNQLVARKFLEKAGLRVDIANNGLEAIKRLERDVFDVVLMDIQMPVMDGLEATRIIRKRPELANIPIVAMTAHAMAGDREISLEAGMSDHVTKPIDFAELFSLLEKILSPKEISPEKKAAS